MKSENMSNANDGKRLENYVEQLERIFRPQNAIVKRNEYIPWEYGEKPRQCDVTVRFQIIGGDFLIIIEAKDFKHKPSIEKVEAFIQKCKSLNANHGIMVSSQGFSKPSIKLAKDNNITLLRVANTDDIDWKREIKLPLLIELRTIYKAEIFLNRIDGLSFNKNFVPPSYLEKKYAFEIQDRFRRQEFDLRKDSIYKLDFIQVLDQSGRLTSCHVNLKLYVQRCMYYRLIPAYGVNGYENLHENNLILATYGHLIPDSVEKIRDKFIKLGEKDIEEFKEPYTMCVSMSFFEPNGLEIVINWPTI